MRFFKDIAFPYFGAVEDGHKRCHIPIYYGIQYNESGTLHLRIGKAKCRTYQGPCAFITHPGTEFFYEIPRCEQHNYYAICFTGSRVNEFIKNGLLDISPKVYKINDPERFRNTISSLIEKHNTPEDDFCVLELQNLLLQLHLPYNKTTDDCKIPHGLLKKITDLSRAIRQSPRLDWNFSVEARKLNISPRYFRMVFTGANRLSPHKFLLRERLAKAAQALISSDETIYNIAGENGFKDAFYFSRMFKKHYKLSPSQYRKEFS